MFVDFDEMMKRYEYDYKLLANPDCDIKIIQSFFNIYTHSVFRKQYYEFWFNNVVMPIANNPNTPEHILASLVIKEKLMYNVLNNPAIPLLLLENPGLMDKWLSTQGLIYLAKKHNINLPISSKPEQIICLHEIKDFASNDGFAYKGYKNQPNDTHQNFLFKYLNNKYKIEIDFTFRNDEYKKKFNSISLRFYDSINNRYRLIEHKTISMKITWREDLRQIIKSFNEPMIAEPLLLNI